MDRSATPRLRLPIGLEGDGLEVDAREGEWFGHDAHCRRNFQRGSTSGVIVKFDESCGPTLIGLSDSGDIRAIRFCSERLILERRTDCFQAEVARVGVGCMPQYDALRRTV